MMGVVITEEFIDAINDFCNSQNPAEYPAIQEVLRPSSLIAKETVECDSLLWKRMVTDGFWDLDLSPFSLCVWDADKRSAAEWCFGVYVQGLEFVQLRSGVWWRGENAPAVFGSAKTRELAMRSAVAFARTIWTFWQIKNPSLRSNLRSVPIVAKSNLAEGGGRRESEI